MTKRIALLGATGSIGTQTLDVLEKLKDKSDFELVFAACSTRGEQLYRRFASDEKITVVADGTIKSEGKAAKVNSTECLNYAETYDDVDIVINGIGGLTLAYKPIDKWQYLDVEVAIDKDEIKPDTNHLVCPVTFTGLSYWYEKSEYQTGQRSEAGGKTYRYSYRYNYGSGPSSIFTFDLSLPSYFKMEIMGECKNPVWRVIQNGETVLSGKINADISSTHKLVVNTDPSEMEIGEYTKTNTFVKSLYGRSDFSTERIFALPAGQCTFAVLAEGTSRPNVFVEVKKHV